MNSPYKVNGKDRRLSAKKAENLAARGKSVESFEDKSVKGPKGNKGKGKSKGKPAPVLADLSRDELRKIAKDRGIPRYSKLSKPNLLEALNG